MAKTINRDIRLQVKRINNRYADLLKEYGEDNEQVKKYTALLGQVSTYDPTKKYRIATPSKLTQEDLEIINKADNLASLSIYTSHKIDEFLHIKGDELKGKLANKTRSQIAKMKEFKQYVQESSDFSKFIYENSQLLYNTSTTARSYLKQTGKKYLDKEQYNYILDLMRRLKQNKMQIIEDYDETYNENYNPFE